MPEHLGNNLTFLLQLFTRVGGENEWVTIDAFDDIREARQALQELQTEHDFADCRLYVED